ncbi:MAG: agmatine deiminase family protein [Akkermansia sp.]|nr:agmatine deiminase family protein [Akkermansia sp.]
MNDPLQGDALRWPAEWEALEAVWISWPHREDLWQGGLQELMGIYAGLAAEIAREAEVRINAAASLHSMIERHLQVRGVQRYRLYDHPTNDVWCRDHGPIFVQLPDGTMQVADWTFNAWGGKFSPWDADNAIPQRIADTLCTPRLSSPMILEGGAIEGNGQGLLLTTEAVLLNPNRNPGMSKADIEAELHRMLGTRSVFWLGQGIEGDDTDGHIDDMVRFVNAEAVVSITEADVHSPHYRELAENNERLQDLRTPDGSRVEMVPLPMPKPLVAKDWRLEQLPASYANFLICNGSVIVPIFMQQKEDDRALGILRECFPGRRVVGIDARRLVLEGGAIHCITQQQPAVKRGRIGSESILVEA